MIKQYIIFNPLGEILRSISCPEDMINIQIQVDETAMEGEANDITQYIPDINLPIIMDKSANPTSIDKTIVLADGVDLVNLSNIPNNASISITGADNFLEQSVGNSEILTFDTPATYKITIKAFPYLDYEVEINAN